MIPTHETRPGGRYRWRLASPAPAQSQDLARELALPPLLGGLLWNRGLSDAGAAGPFLRASLEDLHDPFLMKDMDRAADRLARAVMQGERSIVYGDYDVDGLCAMALLARFFREVGRRVETYVPDRMREGYGMNREAVRRLAAGGRGVLIAVDTGITNAVEVEAARAAGLEVIVADHHQPPQTLPPAWAILNPHRPGCGYPGKTLCGAGIVFKLLAALRRRLRDLGWPGPFPNLKRQLDLVALGTVADVASLRGENRVLVRHGLQELAASRKPGLQALLRVSGTRPEPAAGRSRTQTLAYGQVAFRLAPRINAAGRLGRAEVGLDLLIEEDPVRALEWAGRLDRFNRKRQEIQDEILAQARDRVRRAAIPAQGPIVLADRGWHVGVLGIVASKLVEEFCRPAVLIGLDGEAGRGSARSIPALHVQRALTECADLLQRFGGHAEAAGMTLAWERVGEFAERFTRVVRGRLSPEDCVPVLQVEARVRLSELSLEVVEALERLSPFGPGNVRPVLCAEGLRVVGPVRTVGRDGRHLRVELHDPAGGPSVEAIGFGMGEEERLDFLSDPGAPVDAAFAPQVNRWDGRARVQLNLRDLCLGRGVRSEA